MCVHEGCYLLGETCKDRSKFKCYICEKKLKNIPKCCVCPIDDLHSLIQSSDKKYVFYNI